VGPRRKKKCRQGSLRLPELMLVNQWLLERRQPKKSSKGPRKNRRIFEKSLESRH